MTDIQPAEVFAHKMEKSRKALMKKQRCEILHKGKGQFINTNKHEPGWDSSASGCSRCRLILFSLDHGQIRHNGGKIIQQHVSWMSYASGRKHRPIYHVHVLLHAFLWWNWSVNTDGILTSASIASQWLKVFFFFNYYCLIFDVSTEFQNYYFRTIYCFTPISKNRITCECYRCLWNYIKRMNEIFELILRNKASNTVKDRGSLFFFFYFPPLTRHFT